MSTILNALQKQKSEPAYQLSHMHSNRYWKVVISLSLFVIITLLSALIFILLTSLDSANKQAEDAALFMPAHSLLVEVKPALLKQSAPKLITQVLFETKQLPNVLFQKKQLPLPVDQITSDELIVKDKPQQVISVTQKELQDDPKIDYSNVSDKLQASFERALLMSKDETKAIIESADGDGSDIHQMASNFQDLVPAISYEFHVYSSVAKSRWIRINGEDLVEGQFDNLGKIQVVEIQANRTIFRLGSQSFSLQSLTNWKL